MEKNNFMRRIQYFNKELTVEEYIKKEVCKNGGTQSVAFKEQLIAICEEKEISVEKQMSKEELFDVLIENGYSHKNFAEKFGVGVSSQVYQQSFSISHREVKRLEKHGILKAVGEYRFRAYGKYNYAPLYDIYQYAEMTDAEMKGLLEEYPDRKKS